MHPKRCCETASRKGAESKTWQRRSLSSSSSVFPTFTWIIIVIFLVKTGSDFISSFQRRYFSSHCSDVAWDTLTGNAPGRVDRWRLTTAATLTSRSRRRRLSAARRAAESSPRSASVTTSRSPATLVALREMKQYFLFFLFYFIFLLGLKWINRSVKLTAGRTAVNCCAACLEN